MKWLVMKNIQLFQMKTVLFDKKYQITNRSLSCLHLTTFDCDYNKTMQNPKTTHKMEKQPTWLILLGIYVCIIKPFMYSYGILDSCYDFSQGYKCVAWQYQLTWAWGAK